MTAGPSSRLIVSVLRLQGATEGRTDLALLAWLANPFVFAVSARGSADSLSAVLLLLVLHCLLQGTFCPAVYS